ncbi:uncharacterized protein LOC130448444 [Diorhabda sublineata]|uniref:uncharacterized protein LOC130448444 n=1 Tax=Diorhabda sublineata TaxID=1163346 RepID=UPI0024E0D1DF|nr:uncharacterized protein LOC130448444 [Diorhabda sublineata]
MSPRTLVTSLKLLCLKIISNKLIYALSDDEGKNYEIVSNYLTPTTFEVLQDLLKIILDSVNLDASIRFSCIEILLREDVRKLDTGMFPQFYYDKILRVITERGQGLQHLNLKGVWVRDFPDLLSQLVRSLKGLKSLFIPHMANDDVIEAILTLEHLRVLDISGEACFTGDGVKHLRSNTLQMLSIGYFGKLNICETEENSGIQLISHLLKNLPNLISLRTYSYTGRAVSLLHSEFPDYKTNLKYLHDTGTSKGIMESMLNLCPDLENLHLDGAECGVLEKLGKLRKLNTLKLTKCDVVEFLTFLRQSGSQLHTLKLNHNKNTSLDLSEICLLAPNLQTLECYHMKLTHTNLDTYFMSLVNVEFSYCEVSDDVIRFVFTNSPFLRKISVGSVIKMTDGDMFRLCAECDLINLEELWFSCAMWLTSTTVELLMGHCPKLKVIGHMDGWDVSQEDIEYLRAVVICTNTDLTLFPANDL